MQNSATFVGSRANNLSYPAALGVAFDGKAGLIAQCCAEYRIMGKSDQNLLRAVRLGDTGYMLKLWSNGLAGDRVRCAYQFSNPEGVILFSGDDYLPPRVRAKAESDYCLRCLIGFFLVGADDVEPEYFDNYSPEALKFRDSSDRENLWGFGAELSNFVSVDADDYPFVDVV